jgi:hypothetical protein
MMNVIYLSVKGDGILALYNGLSASMVRQLTYSTARFAIYEVTALLLAIKGPYHEISYL